MNVIRAISPSISNGYRFILVAIEYFTKWVESISYKHVTKKVVTDFLRNNGYGWIGFIWVISWKINLQPAIVDQQNFDWIILDKITFSAYEENHLDCNNMNTIYLIKENNNWAPHNKRFDWYFKGTYRPHTKKATWQPQHIVKWLILTDFEDCFHTSIIRYDRTFIKKILQSHFLIYQFICNHKMSTSTTEAEKMQSNKKKYHKRKFHIRIFFSNRWEFRLGQWFNQLCCL